VAGLGNITFGLGNPGSLLDALSPGELSLGFKTGFIFEFRMASTQHLPDNLREISPLALQLNPQSYTLQEPFASALTPVESNEVLAEENGIIQREITLEGTTGVKGSANVGSLESAIRDVGAAFKAIGQDKSKSGEQPGIQNFFKLRNFFRAYSEAKQDPEIARDLIMVLHVMRDDDHFVVVPKSFTTPRDANTRLHYKYRIELTAIGTVIPDPEPPSAELGLGDGIRTLLEGVQDTRAAFAELSELQGAIKGKIANISAIMIQTAGMIQAVKDFGEGFKDLVDMPREQAILGLEVLENAADRSLDPGAPLEGDLAEGHRAMGRVVSGMQQALLQPEKFGKKKLGQREAEIFAGERLVTNTDVDNRTAGGKLGSRTRVVSGSGGFAGLATAGFDSSVTARVRKGDTIASVAARYRSTKEGIILLNDLRAPYITVDGGPGILRPGDEVLIPVARGGAIAGTQPSSDYLTVEDSMYGVDMRLDPVLLNDGIMELSVDQKHGRLDVEHSFGIANVVQGLQILLHTARGATKFLPDLGIVRDVGMKGTVQRMLFASVSIRETILSDPRIEEIIRADIKLDGDSLTQEITPRVRGRAEGITLVLPFGKASGA
jgi:hypothetical protein